MVFDSLSRAFTTTRKLLFEPFDALKWLKWGVIVFLIQLTSGGPGPQLMWHGGGGKGSGHGDALKILLPFILFVGVFVLLIAVIIWAVFLYLSSRATFMYIHGVSKDSAQLGEAWRAHPKETLSLFWWRIFYSLGTVLIILVTVGIPLIFFALRVSRHSLSAADIPFLVLAGLLLLLVGGAAALIGAITKDFVAPIMVRRKVGVLTGWREAISLLGPHVGSLALFYIMKVLLVVMAGGAIVAAVFMTCCCLIFFLIIPIIGQALTQPIHVFFRSWSLHFLGMLNPELDLFVQHEAIQEESKKEEPGEEESREEADEPEEE
ncbi:MAG TPA: hypothetical protein PLD04_07540 [Thermoanaerobaculia bacterium]|nr:hypothetical protein [Thermoanaerobaculia bacterium]